MAQPLPVPACSRCGAVAEGDGGGPPPGWSMTVEGGRRVAHCGPCVRANIRSIEGKLPEEYWES